MRHSPAELIDTGRSGCAGFDCDGGSPGGVAQGFFFFFVFFLFFLNVQIEGGRFDFCWRDAGHGKLATTAMSG